MPEYSESNLFCGPPSEDRQRREVGQGESRHTARDLLVVRRHLRRRGGVARDPRVRQRCEECTPHGADLDEAPT